MLSCWLWLVLLCFRVVWIGFGECFGFGVDICPASLVEYSTLTQGGSVPLVARED